MISMSVRDDAMRNSLKTVKTITEDGR